MEKVRAYSPVLQFFNDDGSPMVGGHLETYKAGTSIPVTTYADESGTLNPVSIPLDSRGECTVFIVPGMKYKFVLKDKDGVVKWTADNYSVSGGSGGGGGGSSVPFVRVAFQNGAWSKLYGDDGFLKANEFGQQVLYLPEGGWWHIDATLAVKNNTAQDLLQHISLEWNWNFFIEEGVPWGSYAAYGFPSMMHQIDYTRTATNNRCFGFVVNKDGIHTNDWLSVGLNAYKDTLPDSVEWAVWMDIFKVRDA